MDINGFRIINLGLFIKEHSTLIFTDPQLGYEEYLNKQGVMIPRFQYKEMFKRAKSIIDSCSPKRIIINGDIKHEFDSISTTEWRHVIQFLDMLSLESEVVLIRGNHDTFLEPVAAKRNLMIKEYYLLGNIYICHGHEIPHDDDFKKSKYVIIGHEHPAVGLKDKGRYEKFKCFLKGSYQNKILIVQPSLNLVVEGTNVLNEKMLSPFLKRINNFEVYIVDAEVYYFGKVQDLL